jgi:hypothetical protein
MLVMEGYKDVGVMDSVETTGWISSIRVTPSCLRSPDMQGDTVMAMGVITLITSRCGKGWGSSADGNNRLVYVIQVILGTGR